MFNGHGTILFRKTCYDASCLKTVVDFQVIAYHLILFKETTLQCKGTAVAQCLRHCATNQKVAGSIQDGVIGFFYGHNPFDRTMALGSTQRLTEMSTRNISWG
jgi:hypothetical protein